MISERFAVKWLDEPMPLVSWSGVCRVYALHLLGSASWYWKQEGQKSSVAFSSTQWAMLTACNVGMARNDVADDMGLV